MVINLKMLKSSRFSILYMNIIYIRSCNVINRQLTMSIQYQNGWGYTYLISQLCMHVVVIYISMQCIYGAFSRFFFSFSLELLRDHPIVYRNPTAQRVQEACIYSQLIIQLNYVNVISFGADRLSGCVILDLVPFINIMFIISIKKRKERNGAHVTTHPTRPDKEMVHMHLINYFNTLLIKL